MERIVEDNIFKVVAEKAKKDNYMIRLARNIRLEEETSTANSQINHSNVVQLNHNNY